MLKPIRAKSNSHQTSNNLIFLNNNSINVSNERKVDQKRKGIEKTKIFNLMNQI